MFRPALERLHRDAKSFFAMSLEIPESPGGYYHDYICPRHGVELVFDPRSPGLHRCPSDGETFAGGKFDAAWRWFVNHHLAEAALRLAALWRIEASPGHLDAVRRILFGYAARYEAHSRCGRTGENPGVATYTTLDESVWSIPLAWAYTLIAGELTAAECETIESQLFGPAAEHLVRRRYPRVHNFTCWHNAAIATLGRASGRENLVRFAADGPQGQRGQLAAGVLADGLWFEGSMSYHFYALWAILMSALALRHDPDTDIAAQPAIRSALAAPIACAYPDGALPATNDCWYETGILGPCCHGVPPAPDFYEIGYALYRDPAFAATLQRAYAGTPRDTVYALLFGVEELPRPAATAPVSVSLPASGLAILRPDPEIHLMLKYGPHGGAHGHPDKLGIAGHANGWRFSPDLGTPGYGVDSLESWYRQTLSHNTVLLDGASQPPAHGTLRRFEVKDGCHIAEAAVQWDGVALRRAVLARREYFIDAFDVGCDCPRRIDWVYHNAGEVEIDSARTRPAAIEGGEAYRHLTGVREWIGAPNTVRWLDGRFGMAVWLPPATGERVLSGSAPSNPPAVQFGFLLRTRLEASALFLAVFHPFREEAVVQEVEWTPNGLRVHLRERTDEWQLDGVLASRG